MKTIDNELAILSLACGFLSNYLIGVKEANEDMKVYEPIIKFHNKHMKLVELYRKRLVSLEDKITEVLVSCEQDSKKIEPYNRFKKKARADTDGDVVIHGLLFPMCLMLEHKDIKHRKLNFDYKFCEEIVLGYDKDNKKSISNSRVLASMFVERFKDYV